MKSSIYKLLFAAVAISPVASALSLYDSAPMVGIPESYAMRYTVGASVGYDDNINASATNKQSSMYVGANLGVSYADNESVDKLSYSAGIGGTWYTKNADNSGDKFTWNNYLRANLTHALSNGDVYSAAVTLRYQPEPDYANGISAARVQGDCFNWSLSNSYSHAFDRRWALTLSASYSGNYYSEDNYRNDNRQYLSGSLGLTYRDGERTTYTLSGSYRYDFRSKGYDSNNVYVTLAVNHAIDAISSCNFSVGVQSKFINGESNLYPTMRAGYRRVLAEGLSVNTYVSFDNENVDTYRLGANYLSDATWRLGADFTYALSPVVSFNFGGSLLSAKYSKGTYGMQDRTQTTATLNVGMSYRFTQHLTGHLAYVHTMANRDAGDYDRNRVTVSANYSF